MTLSICLIVTLVGLGLLLIKFRTGSDLNVRVAGLYFQSAGIIVALLTIYDIRSLLDSLTDKNMHLQASAVTTTEARGTLTTHPKSLSTEDRFDVLESQVARLEAMQAAYIAEIRRTFQVARQSELERGQQQLTAIRDVKRVVAELQLGAWPLPLFVVIWLLLGAFLTSAPDVVSRWIENVIPKQGVRERARARGRPTIGLTQRLFAMVETQSEVASVPSRDQQLKALEWFKDFSNYMLLTTVSALGWIVTTSNVLATAAPCSRKVAIAALSMSTVFAILTLAAIPLVTERVGGVIVGRDGVERVAISFFDIKGKFKLFWLWGPKMPIKLKVVCWPQHLLFIVGVISYAIGSMR